MPCSSAGADADAETGEGEPRSRLPVAHGEAHEVSGDAGPQRVRDGIGGEAPDHGDRVARVVVDRGVVHRLDGAEDQPAGGREEQHIARGERHPAVERHHDNRREHLDEFLRDADQADGEHQVLDDVQVRGGHRRHEQEHQHRLGPDDLREQGGRDALGSHDDPEHEEPGHGEVGREHDGDAGEVGGLREHRERHRRRRDEGDEEPRRPGAQGRVVQPRAEGEEDRQVGQARAGRGHRESPGGEWGRLRSGVRWCQPVRPCGRAAWRSSRRRRSPGRRTRRWRRRRW